MTERKASRFNLAVPVDDDDGDVLLFNTATAGLLRVDADTWASLGPLFGDARRGLPRDWSAAVPSDLDEDVTEALAAGGFIVPAELDELGQLREAFERERTRPHLTFTVGLTMACNFACPYCFEEHRNEHMSRATADAVFGFMQEQLGAARAQSVFVNWFGGEPLLNVDVLCHLSERVRAESERIGARYQSLVITNGALLARPVAERLRAAGTTQAQVTLDGPREIHDERRPFKGGQASFDRIVANLREVHDLIQLTIRINVDQGNLGHIGALVRVLKAEGLLDGPHAATIYASKVTAYTEQAQMVWEPLQQRALASLSDPIDRELASLGLPVPRKTSPLVRGTKRGGCSAMHHNSFVIGPKGHLFKCELGIHDPREAVGTLGEAAAAPAPAPDSRPLRRLPVVRQEVGTKAHDWNGYNPFDNEKCSGCQFVPMCKGGCPKRVLEDDTPFMQETCDYWDHNIRRLVTDLAAE
jgi:uncharacterized protein